MSAPGFGKLSKQADCRQAVFQRQLRDVQSFTVNERRGEDDHPIHALAHRTIEHTIEVTGAPDGKGMQFDSRAARGCFCGTELNRPYRGIPQNTQTGKCWHGLPQELDLLPAPLGNIEKWPGKFSARAPESFCPPACYGFVFQVDPNDGNCACRSCSGPDRVWSCSNDSAALEVG